MDVVLPVIDCSACSLANPDFDPDSPASTKLAAEIHKAFTEVGFAYITNHGITEQELTNIWSVSDDFFKLPIEEKRKAERARSGGVTGWNAIGAEAASGEEGDHGDNKELYNFTPHDDDIESRDENMPPPKWPGDDVLPNFIKVNNEMFELLRKLFINFLKLLPRALNLKDPDTFVNMHKKIGQTGSFCISRLLKYPPIQDDVTEGQRLGVHSDYGTLTLNIQRDIGGLEVMTKSGDWVYADPKEGTIFIHPGDSLGFQTSDQYRGTEHRIGLPSTTDGRRKQTRHALIFFGLPDNDASIAPLDGSDMFPERKFLEYLTEKLKKIY